MRKPKALKKGDTIGVITPSGPINKNQSIDKAIADIESYGFKVKRGRAIEKQYGYMAGSESERVNDIHSMFADDTVDGIFCLKGGYGTPRIANMLDMDLIRNNPKVFVGYSDITTILNQLVQFGEMPSFHGLMFVSDSGYPSFTGDSFFKAVTSTEPLGYVKNPEGYKLECLYPGEVTAPIVGGNLTLIGLTMGTPYEIDTKDKILFIEDVNEEPHKIDGRLCQLRNAGKLDECAGFIIGDFCNAHPQDTDPSLSLDEVIQDLIITMKKPVLGNFRVGHCEPKMTIPFGISATLNATKTTLIFNESACV